MKNRDLKSPGLSLAERVGFEPTGGFWPPHALQACALDPSATSPLHTRKILYTQSFPCSSFHFSSFFFILKYFHTPTAKTKSAKMERIFVIIDFSPHIYYFTISRKGLSILTEIVFSVIDIHKHENNMWISSFTKLKITVKKHFI
ncbi:hypothetical protein TM_1779 [Thermotoga maritima MSB8]|uniref:Uncharacterized protein n=1 Tax=Thermotoga maritima (strain ATCC 43589 / DSM 3109 / JCM 10099 / NBRC 100826 / MSB8) TaxID=243274 RepID=Q9X2A0_THEMA|nr:hypothetical protein TM_1779 [Thermotoga maritima MSB8]